MENVINTWLADCGLTYKVNRVKKPDYPLRAYQDFQAFKLFVVDIGLLGAMSRLNAKIILDGKPAAVCFGRFAAKRLKVQLYNYTMG